MIASRPAARSAAQAPASTWDQLSRDLKPIYTAVHAKAAAAALDDLDAKWGARYPAIIRLSRNAWEEFIPFLDYDVEIRKVLCSTNAIES
jgi:putative transposase